MLFEKFKEVFDHNDIVAVDITFHPLGEKCYVLRFYPIYNDSYTIDFYYANFSNEMLMEKVQKGWFDKHNIGEQDIQIILKDSVHTVSELYDKYMEKL